ncbi:hypothetical protein B0H19DRAFT_426004 [Mycena capillaripes]|nr:hypothetical protein B0H19DRAFT_426004 [Mycena capillaripes]
MRLESCSRHRCSSAFPPAADVGPIHEPPPFTSTVPLTTEPARAGWKGRGEERIPRRTRA